MKKKHMMGLICFAVFFGNSQLPSQEIQKIPHLPLVYEVLFPPSPVKGEGEIHLIYELHMTNFLGGALSLRRIEALGDGKNLIKTYQGEKLSECLVRPGKPLDMEDKSILESGTRAVLFIMLSFGKSAEVPDFLTHRVTVEYFRSSGEKVSLQGEGAQIPILRKEPLMISPPVHPGVWLAGNCTGDGPMGHRLSMQAWNSRLVVNQRYAIDFMKFSNDYRLVHGESSSNSNWHSYGEEVIAVADGVISDIKESIIENTPLGKYAVSNSLEYAAGNYVILNIGQGVYAVYLGDVVIKFPQLLSEAPSTMMLFSNLRLSGHLYPWLHQPPQAELCRSEAAPASDRLSGIIDGRRGRQ